ncbi:MAG: ABC transporter substrate-binding protein [Syntrophaceae bacterium]|nr:ABC transporter substrate-binding protein [Syntrophaceae bacterium]
MSKFKALFAIVLLVLFVASPVRAAQDTIRIGAAFALTGSIAVYGEGFRKCVDLAVDEINAKGGIKGKKIQIVYEDNKSTPKDCVTAVRKLITVDKVPVLFGPAGSSNFMAAAPVAQESKAVMVSAQGTAEKLTQAGPFIFRIIPSNAKQGQRLAKLAFDMGYKKLPVMYVNNDWGLDLKDGFVESFKKMGGVVTDIIPFDEKKTDYRTELLRVNRGNPAAIVNLTYINEGAVQFKQAYEMGIKTQWLCGSAARAPKMVELAGKAAEGVIGTYPSVPQDTKQYKAFKDAYRKKYGDDKIPIFGDYNYDMVYLVAKAIEKGGYTAEGIRKALPAVAKGYKGVTGDKTFDAKRGMLNADMGLWTVKDGKIIDYKK